MRGRSTARKRLTTERGGLQMSETGPSDGDQEKLEDVVADIEVEEVPDDAATEEGCVEE
jgi:hypothetical protein